jgi:AraC-like DNA-binding protein
MDPDSLDCPLASFAIAQPADVEEAASLISMLLNGRTRINRVADPRRFRLQLNGVRLGRLALCANYFSTDTLEGPGMLEDGVIFTYGHSGRSVAHLDDTAIAGTWKTGALISPGQKIMGERPRHSIGIYLHTPQAALIERYRELTGHEPKEPFAFERVVDLTRGSGAAVLSAVKFALQELARDPSSMDRRLFRMGIEDMLLTALLGLPNRYSSELEQTPRGDLPPRVVRLAEEYIEAHADEAVSVSDLVHVCGCSQSALFQAFHTARGYSPMQFLTEVRLCRAHQRLSSDSGHTVSSVAFDAGFNHLGRFAEAYRKRFGETPSETLGRHKKRSRPTIGTPAL